MDISKICFNCMKGEVDDQGICNCCGKQFSDIKLSERYLPVGSFLREKYLMGKVLGEGGFGITYIGYDINLDAQVAIKEFFPSNFASREKAGPNVIPHEGDAEDFFIKQRDRFLGEAKRLAKFRNTPAVVSVLDFFKDNGTAYLVMNYIDGMTLRRLLDYSDGRITVEETLKIIEPIMLALKEIHDSGFIHRDISPDNIMISNENNRVYLIDFGTARTNSSESEKTISVFKKSGYTPPEQLRTKGNQGPWTDIYALCATIYRCIVGAKPLDVTDRLFGDVLHKPSEYGIKIAPAIEDAIMKGLEIHNEDRFQSMDELYDAIYKTDAWKNVSTEEYTKVIEAVRNYKKQGDTKDKVKEAIKRQTNANASPALFVDASQYDDEHVAVMDVVRQYKESPEYKAAYERFVKEDPEYLRQLEYQKIKEVVRAYKASKYPNIHESQLIDDIMTEMGTAISEQ